VAHGQGTASDVYGCSYGVVGPVSSEDLDVVVRGRGVGGMLVMASRPPSPRQPLHDATWILAAEGDGDRGTAEEGSGGDGEDDDDDVDDDVEPLLKFRRVEGSLPELLAGDAATCLAVHHRYLVRGLLCVAWQQAACMGWAGAGGWVGGVVRIASWSSNT
jgi:hypothetical protein